MNSNSISEKSCVRSREVLMIDFLVMGIPSSRLHVGDGCNSERIAMYVRQEYDNPILRDTLPPCRHFALTRDSREICTHKVGFPCTSRFQNSPEPGFHLITSKIRSRFVMIRFPRLMAFIVLNGNVEYLTNYGRLHSFESCNIHPRTACIGPLSQPVPA